MDLDIDVSMSLKVIAPLSIPSAPNPLLRSSRTHDHSDGSMLSVVVPGHGVVDADAGHARTSSDR